MWRIALGLWAVVVGLEAQQAASFEESVRAAMAPSIEKQRASIQKQAASAQPSLAASGTSGNGSPFFSVNWPLPPQWTGAPECDPMAKPDLDGLVKAASEKEGLSEKLVTAVIGKESGARPCAISPKGAEGLMQLMPGTAAELGVVDPFDPKQNIAGGTHLLKQLLTRYNGDVALALGAYNAGAGRIDREGGLPEIPETIDYVSEILNRFRIQ